MNPIIKKQLDKCKVAQIPDYDDTTTQLFIPKGSVLNITPYQVHKCYLVELAEWIIHPTEDSTLAANWNKGSIPKSKYYQAEISQTMGKMVRITGCGVDTATGLSNGDVWEGWIPQQGIKIINELK